MTTPLGAFGAPPDALAWVILGIAVALVAGGRRLAARLRRIPDTTFVTLAAVVAAALSAGYVTYYLRGGPRIVDATSYWLEARALATGALAFDVPSPVASFSGRFLLQAPESGALAVIFPPGYPAALALGFLAGSPLAVGPATAAAIVVVTWTLARRVFDRDVARFAVTLSVATAALRYHTADTMSHGWAALLLATALLAAIGRSLPGALVAGLASGWLVATRPVTGALGIALVAWLVLRRPNLRWGRGGVAAVGLLPGVALLAAHQHAATGSWLDSVQIAYYAAADGPPGCLEWGFGSGIGCLYEHGDFVRANLPDGYGSIEAVMTTLRRLRHHTMDVANAEPLALLVPFALVTFWRRAEARALGLASFGIVAAYAPFYFDGNYPGGGARMFADVLPLEHVLVAAAAMRLRVDRFAGPLALAGFALHASFDHLALRDREGGRPMFEPSVLAMHGVTHGLVFVATDHGFNLGHRPGDRQLVVARRYGDGHDRVLWEHLGRPPTYEYRYDPSKRAAAPSLVPYQPIESDRFEAEAHWPPRAVTQGWAYPGFTDARCSSNRRGLRLRSDGGSAAVALMLAPLEEAGPIRTWWSGPPGAKAEVDLRLGAVRWTERVVVGPEGCATVESPSLPSAGAERRLDVTIRGDSLLLDAIVVGARSAAADGHRRSGRRQWACRRDRRGSAASRSLAASAPATLPWTPPWAGPRKCVDI